MASIATASWQGAQAQLLRVNPPEQAKTVLTSARTLTPGFSTPTPYVRPLAKATDATPSRIPLRAPGAVPEIFGSVVYSDRYNAGDLIGMYSINPGDSQNFTVRKIGVNATWGGVLCGDDYFTFSAKRDEDTYEDFFALERYDASSWELVSQDRYKAENDADRQIIFNFRGWDMAYDPSDGWVYGCYLNGEDLYSGGAAFRRVNYYTKQAETIKVISDNHRQYKWWYMAFDNDGTLYAIDSNGDLLTVDKATGNTTRVGSTGFINSYVSSMAVDPASGRMFASASLADGTACMYEIDKTTGHGTRLQTYSLSEEIAGMFIPGAMGGAPAPVSQLALSFPEGSLSGTVSFVLPTTTSDGISISGTLKWSVKDGVEEIASGEGECGQSVTIPVTLAASGNHTIRVCCENARGKSENAEATAFIGPDVPLIPFVSLQYDYPTKQLIASWIQPSATLNGGYFNPADVTYRVVLQPTGQVLAEAATSNVLLIPMDVPEIMMYHLEVEATYAGLTGSPVASAPVRFGYIPLPFTERYNSAEAAAGYTIVDVNGDADYSGGRPAGTWWWDADFNYYRAQHRSTTEPMDDWLITPAVRLQAGKYYTVRTTMTTFNDYPEGFEIKAGKANAPEFMTIPVVAKENFVATQKTPVSGFFTVDEDGCYFIGIHSNSTGSMSLFLHDLSVEEVDGNSKPQPVTGLTVEPVSGTHNAVLRFTAPSKTVGDLDLTELSKIEIYRKGQVNEELIHTIENPVPGSQIEWTHVDAPMGNIQYFIYAWLGPNKSDAATETSWIGVPLPYYPENVQIVENPDNFGEVTMSWNQVNTTWDKKPLDPSLVTYNMITQVGNQEAVQVYQNTTELSYTARMLPEGAQQEFVGFRVQAETETGKSVFMASAYIPVGHPYQTPYRESFEGGHLSYLWLSGPVYDNTNTHWGVYGDNVATGSYDGDNGFVAMSGAERPGDGAYLTTAKVSLAGCEAPKLKLYAYVLMGEDGQKDLNTLEIRVKENGEWTSLTTFPLHTLLPEGESGWAPAVVDLSQYAGKVVQIDIIGRAMVFQNIFLDNIIIGDLNAEDLAVKNFSISEIAETGEDYDISLSIVNRGDNIASGHTVELYRDGQLMETRQCDPLGINRTATLSFTDRFNPASEDSRRYHAVILYDKDLVPDNNTSAEMTVRHIKSDLPAVSDLKASVEENDVTLSWTEPVTAGVAVSAPRLEDFESYPSFAYENLGDWTLVDEDNQVVGGIEGVTLPGIPSKLAWFVMDCTLDDFGDGAETFRSFSGIKHLSNLYTGQASDWLISPELSGRPQTVSFMARSYSASYPETLEVYYSAGSTATAEFRLLTTLRDLPEDWTAYRVTVPEGAKRFAIRCISADAFMAFIDDIRFKVLSEQAGLEIAGYNVWRDGVKLTENPVTDTSYLDTEAPLSLSEPVTYHVSTVYNLGESVVSNSAEALYTSSLESSASDSVDISLNGNILTVKAPAGTSINIYNVDGKTAYAAVADKPVTDITLAPGAYIAKAGAVVRKVIVR